METISLSVRRLIEFVMRSGDIDNSYRSTQRMLEGIRAHKKIQDAYEATIRERSPSVKIRRSMGFAFM
uniref:hypothetical protein n=1 Tax=Ndongobacter massiliensis TaxID=1871025 RepID=UPI0009F80AD6|nr:hypothetical protein [Ndongobacter massiliensis]